MKKGKKYKRKLKLNEKGKQRQTKIEVKKERKHEKSR